MVACSCRRVAKWVACPLGFLGVLLLVGGTTMLVLFPSLIQKKISKNLMLKEGGENFERWSNPPIPLIMRIYVFNLTNPSEFAAGKKAVLEEIGPFVFTEIRKKEILETDYESVTYRDHKLFIFERNQSVGSLDQMVYTLNVPLVGFAAGLKAKLGYFLHWTITALLNTQREKYNLELVVHVPIRQLLFEGYKVQLFEDLTKAAKAFRPTTSDIMPNNTFGLLYGKNNSGEGVYKVYSGEAGMRNFTQIITWNNMDALPWWDSNYCNMINGSDGAQYPPPVTRDDTLYVYNPELCRSVYIQYEKDVVVRGIPAYRFIMPKKLFGSPAVNPDNRCYCTIEDQCHRNGLLLLESCRKGAPVVLSAPHFYQSDKDILNTVEGLNPTKEKHETFADIEPATGVVVNAARKIQINIMVEKFSNFEQFENIPEEKLLYPMAWLSESAQISKELSEAFIAKVKTPVKLGKIILILATVVGITLILSASVVGYCLIKWKQKTPAKVIKHTYEMVNTKLTADDLVQKKPDQKTPVI